MEYSEYYEPEMEVEHKPPPERTSLQDSETQRIKLAKNGMKMRPGGLVVA
jgi:hypothetical protein